MMSFKYNYRHELKSEAPIQIFRKLTVSFFQHSKIFMPAKVIVIG